MSSTKFFYCLDEIFQTMFIFYDKVGNVLNYSFLALGFVGFFIWMNYQRKFNHEAKNKSGQLK
ncbi:MAG: hypothetical protein HYU67_08670 [Flavobacteriia bacterium]|nr:hypothetical protein [Flavobacteriia bacterium]